MSHNYDVGSTETELVKPSFILWFAESEINNTAIGSNMTELIDH